MCSYKRIKKAIKSNKKGYSLIEVLIVVFIMAALLAVSTGSFTAYFNARPTKVAKTLDVMIAQSKIDALSGRDNLMIIRSQTAYDKTEDGSLRAGDYYAELYRIEGDKAYRYKKESIGNSWVTINMDNDPTKEIKKDDNNLIAIIFNGKSGA
ncbi:MAG: prepilin-type N-terminal cleavage/methylation domain-containing protein, partial [Clostridia bacterium]|nr:prepilin-type N-terminal cleavage/methylation domain-containing protein [Clostridia bacterium]